VADECVVLPLIHTYLPYTVTANITSYCLFLLQDTIDSKLITNNN